MSLSALNMRCRMLPGWLVTLLLLAIVSCSDRQSTINGDESPPSAETLDDRAPDAGGTPTGAAMASDGTRAEVEQPASEDIEVGGQDELAVESVTSPECESTGPVCAGDGQLYDTLCEVEEAGLRTVAGAHCGNAPTDSCTSSGPVQTTGVSVIENPYCEGEWGDPCGADGLGDCPEGHYCDYLDDAQCGHSGPGMCLPIPNFCTLQFEPVCGCDGNTYGNPCGIGWYGVSIASEGACEPTGRPCGGDSGEVCAEGEFCDFDTYGRCVDGDCSNAHVDENQCGHDGVAGNCRPVPESCPDVSKPVCGCDGETYESPCFAQMNGVSVADRVACESAP